MLYVVDTNFSLILSYLLGILCVMMIMSYFAKTTMREIERMNTLCVAYEKQLESLPKGSLQVKERNEKKYYYLAYRHNGTVVSDYIGNDEDVASNLKEQLHRRRGIETLLKSIKKELALMNKVLEMAK